MCEHQTTKYNKNHGGPLSGVPHSFDGLNTSGLRIFSVDDQPLHNYTIEMVCCVHTIFGFMDVEWHSRHVDFKCVKHIFGQLLTFHEQRSGTNGSTTNYFLLVIIPWLLAIFWIGCFFFIKVWLLCGVSGIIHGWFIISQSFPYTNHQFQSSQWSLLSKIGLLIIHGTFG